MHICWPLLCQCAKSINCLSPSLIVSLFLQVPSLLSSHPSHYYILSLLVTEPIGSWCFGAKSQSGVHALPLTLYEPAHHTPQHNLRTNPEAHPPIHNGTLSSLRIRALLDHLLLSVVCHPLFPESFLGQNVCRLLPPDVHIVDYPYLTQALPFFYVTPCLTP